MALEQSEQSCQHRVRALSKALRDPIGLTRPGMRVEAALEITRAGRRPRVYMRPRDTGA